MAEREPNLSSSTEGEFPEMSLAEKEAAFRSLQEMAKEGIVADSDLDGLMGVWLLKEAGVIPADFEHIRYPSHDELKKNGEAYCRFRALSPEAQQKAVADGLFPDFFYRNAGLMVDISPDEIEGVRLEDRADGRPQRPQRDGLISSIRIEGEGKQAKITGRQMYFDHHGPDSLSTSGSSTRKVYRWLLALGKLPSPDTEEGKRIQNIVDFVDAHDNKTYHTDDFGPEQLKLTARNAFGLAYAQEKGKTLMSWHQVPDGKTRLPNPTMVELMALTGGDPTIQLSDEQLRAAGVEEPAKLVSDTKQAIDKGLDFMREWVKQPGRTMMTTDGHKVVIDIRKSNSPENLNQQLSGVDVGDVSTALGFDTHMIYGGVTVTIFTHHEDIRKRLIDLERKFGGTSTRNIYVHNRAHAEVGKPTSTLRRLKEALSGVEAEQPVRPTTATETTPATVEELARREGETILQAADQSCFLAALANIDKLYGRPNPNEDDWSWRAGDTGLQLYTPEKGIDTGKLADLAKQGGYEVMAVDSVAGVLSELLDGKAIVIAIAGNKPNQRHAIVAHLDRSQRKLILRDPSNRPLLGKNINELPFSEDQLI
ncbi:MAG: hypothetical protein WC400_02795, partial [Patescibacteria group bacterium]